jgi:hypothetical protein
MTVTLTASYRDTLAPETVAEIDRLIDGVYALDDILVFIDEHSEEDFREYYEEYVEAGENFGYDAVDTFINEIADLSYLDKFAAAYIGEYSSPARMAEDFLENEVDQYGDHYFRTYF